jgi:hypothetical protein
MFYSGRPAVREEVDKSLYYDTKENTFFVVESTEIESGPRIHTGFSKKAITEQEARDIIASRPDMPELSEKAARYFRNS